MPPQIPEFDPQLDVHAAPTPQTSPGAYAAGGEALARGAGEVSAEMAQFGEVYANARRHADAANTVANTSKALSDVRFKYSKVPDRAAALAGYDDEAGKIVAKTLEGINDPLVKQAVDANLAAELKMQREETGHAAFGMESSRRVGELDTNLAAMAQNAATAATPELRAKIADDGAAMIRMHVAGGWMMPETGAQREIQWTSQIQEVSARQMLDGVEKSLSPTAAATASKAISDPASFPGLLPETRERLAYRIDGLQNRILAHQAAQDAHNETVLHRAQGHNEAVMLANIYNGQNYDPDTVVKLATSGQISAGGIEAIHAAQDRTREGRDDPVAAVRLWHAIDTGQATPQDVYDASKRGDVKATTATTMVRAIDGGTTPASRHAVQILNLAITGSGNGNFTGFASPQDKIDHANALGEFYSRVANGEHPDAALAEVALKYAKKMDQPTFLAQPKLGAVHGLADIAKVVAATRQAYESGRLDQATATAEGDLLANYQRFYAGAEERKKAQAAALAKQAAQNPKAGGNP